MEVAFHYWRITLHTGTTWFAYFCLNTFAHELHFCQFVIWQDRYVCIVFADEITFNVIFIAVQFGWCCIITVIYFGVFIHHFKDSCSEVLTVLIFVRNILLLLISDVWTVLYIAIASICLFHDVTTNNRSICSIRTILASFLCDIRYSWFFIFTNWCGNARLKYFIYSVVFLKDWSDKI